MINRSLYKNLTRWKNAVIRKPLILRGARQVGKTTLIESFSKGYEQYLYFNLETKDDLEIFDSIRDFKKCVQLIFLSRSKKNNADLNTLIFIDEVQENPLVIESLRYFYEEYPYLHVIVTGSLLEFAMEEIERTPVGRVEYMELHPVNFPEYLQSVQNESALELFQQLPLENNLLPYYFKLFHEYSLIGGMPQIVSAYTQNKDLSMIMDLYASIIESYKADVEKYGRNETQRRIIRHIIHTAPYEVDKRINLNLFGQSSFGTREIKDAMLSLEKARILKLIYPTTHTSLPASPDFKKRPRLQLLDIGLVNYQLGLHKELLTIQDLHDTSRGSFVQLVIYQELKSLQYLPGEDYRFWVREDKSNSSEVDLVYSFNRKLIPVEIKSGSSGTLRSLHEYIDRCDHTYAVRFYFGKISIDTLISRKGKSYQLLNLPYFLISQIDRYLEWFVKY